MPPLSGSRFRSLAFGGVPPQSICDYAHCVRSDYCGGEFVSAIISNPDGAR